MVEFQIVYLSQHGKSIMTSTLSICEPVNSAIDPRFNYSNAIFHALRSISEGTLLCPVLVVVSYNKTN